MNVIRIDKTLVAYIKGKQYAKEIEGSSNELLSTYESLLNSTEEEAIKFFKAPKTSHEVQLELEFEAKKEEAKKFEDILDFMKDVRDNGHDLFEVKNNSIYLKGINISMPELLVREIIKTNENKNRKDFKTADEELINWFDQDSRLNALINFWSLCAMNPDPRARHDAFRFIERNGLTITKSGNVVTYRRVWVKNEGNKELEKFVTQEYLKIRRWKKSAKNYDVYLDNDSNYFLHNFNGVKDVRDGEDKFLGNLDYLFNSISEVSKTVYTDNHTRSFNIKIGEPILEHRGSVDSDPEVECSKGIHTGCPDYVNGNSWLGDTILVCLVNPKDITAVPVRDSYKMRACKVLPIGIAETDKDGKIIVPDYNVLDLELAQNTQEELELMSNMSSTELEEYKKHEFIAPELDFKSVRNIKDNIELSLEEANEIVNNRKI